MGQYLRFIFTTFPQKLKEPKVKLKELNILHVVFTCRGLEHIKIADKYMQITLPKATILM